MIVEEWGVDVNLANSPLNGKAIEPALVVAARHGDQYLVEFLLTKGANVNVLDQRGISPLLEAAIGSYFSWSKLPHGPNTSVLEYLLRRKDISLSNKIDALEFAGANLLLKRSDSGSVFQAFGYWHRAMDLRESVNGRMHKDTHQQLSGNNIIAWRSVEWTTRDQLRELLNNPLQHEMQAFLVKQRIMTGNNVTTLYQYEELEPHSQCHNTASHQNCICAKILEKLWICLEDLVRDEHQVIKSSQTTNYAVWMIEKLVETLINLKCRINPAAVIINDDALLMSLNLIAAIESIYDLDLGWNK